MIVLIVKLVVYPEREVSRAGAHKLGGHKAGIGDRLLALRT